MQNSCLFPPTVSDFPSLFLEVSLIPPPQCVSPLNLIPPPRPFFMSLLKDSGVRCPPYRSPGLPCPHATLVDSVPVRFPPFPPFTHTPSSFHSPTRTRSFPRKHKSMPLNDFSEKDPMLPPSADPVPAHLWAVHFDLGNQPITRPPCSAGHRNP